MVGGSASVVFCTMLTDESTLHVSPEIFDLFPSDLSLALMRRNLFTPTWAWVSAMAPGAGGAGAGNILDP